MYHRFPIQVHLNLNCLDVYYEDVNVVWSMTYPYGQECTRHRCLFQSSIGWHIGSGRIRLRLYLFCEGRISVLKRRIQNADPRTPVHEGYCLCLPPRRSRFREHALRMRSLRWPKEACQMGRALSRHFEFRLLFVHARVYSAGPRAQVNRKGVYMTSFKRGYMWFCVYASTRISVLL